MKLSLLIAGLFAATALHAAPVYNNTAITSDTGNTVVYSSGVFSDIGDQIHLAGTERIGDNAAAQFYNLGSDGNFVAHLNLYGLPVNNTDVVGSLLGSYTAASMFLAGGNLLEVSWSLAGLNLPDDLIFTVTVSDFTAGMDLGLTVFDPPTVGSSSDQFFIVKGGGGFAQSSQGNGQDNIYFRLNASSPNRVPEPGSAGLMLLAMLPLIAIQRRRVVSR